MKRALTPVVAVLLLVGSVVGGSVALTGGEQTTAWSAVSCTEPSAADRAATEEYAACRAAEVAGVLSSLPPVPTETVTETATETATVTATETATVTATATTTATVTASPSPTVEPAPLKVIGMSSPEDQWAQRLSEVGPNGIRARRIFGDLTSTGTDKATTIQAAIAANMLPLVSYKVPSVDNAIAGQYDTWARNAADFLNGLDTRILVAIWHEPRGDMTQTQYIALQKRLVPIFQARCALCEVGPLHTAFLLTGTNTQKAEWPTWSDAELLNTWDWFGIDSYQSGTSTSPGSIIPGDRIDPLLAYLASMGHPDMPIVVGEWNGYTAPAISESGEKFLSTPSLIVACLFNSSTGAKGVVLTGDMLAAFRTVKADPRVLQ